jgi:hypothetical protein
MMAEIAVGIVGIMVLIYALDSVFHFGIFEKIDQLLERK